MCYIQHTGFVPDILQANPSFCNRVAILKSVRWAWPRLKTEIYEFNSIWVFDVASSSTSFMHWSVHLFDVPQLHSRLCIVCTMYILYMYVYDWNHTVCFCFVSFYFILIWWLCVCVYFYLHFGHFIKQAKNKIFRFVVAVHKNCANVNEWNWVY